MMPWHQLYKGNCTYVLMSLLIPYTNVKSPDKTLKGIGS